MYSTGMTSQIASNGAFASGAGVAAGYAGGAAVGVYGGRAISNGYSVAGKSGNAAVNVGTVIGSIFAGPIGGAIGGLIGGAANRLFGRKERQTEDTWLNGSFDSSGTFQGAMDDWWREKGGTFRSDKTGKTATNIGGSQAQALTEGYQSLKTMSADFATTLGLNADAIKNRSQAMVIRLNGDAAANEATITKFFTDLGDSLANELVPGLSAFAKVGESASATLQRIAGDYAFVDVAMEAMGKTFSMVGVNSVTAREHLLTLVGGLEALGKDSAFFSQNFLSEAERLAPVSIKVKEAMVELGLSFVDTREEFKNVVQGLDLTTAGGAKTFASLMKIQESFALTTPAIEASNNVMQDRIDLQKQIDDLTMTEAQKLMKQRAALDINSRGMFDQLQAIKAAVAAQDKAKESLFKLVGAMQSFADSTQSMRDSLSVGSLSTLTPEQQYAELRKQYESTKMKAMNGDVGAQGSYNAILNEFLTKSQTLNSGDAQYQADYAMAQADLASMSEWALGQVDVAQAQLNAMNSQNIALETLNNTAWMIAKNTTPSTGSLGLGLGMTGPGMDYSRFGGGDAIVNEIRGLRVTNEAMAAELAALRAEQNKQTGDTIVRNDLAQQQAAETIVTGVASAVKTTNRVTRIWKMDLE
jgi:hypothetical protein